MQTIGFLGVGKMGGAILASLIKSGAARPGDILACDAAAARRNAVRRRHGVRATADPAELAAQCGVIVLAVKPQDLEPLLGVLSPLLTRRHLLVSIAAGKRLARLRELAGDRPRLARAMPNLPVSVGAGMTVFCLEKGASARDRRLVARLLGCCGEALELEERHFDAVTALSGSGPAFYARIMLAMAQAGNRLGLPATAARRLALQTMLGTARYLDTTGQDPGDFVRDVTSPGGTTAAGLAVLEKSTLPRILERVLAAAARRSRELA